jgi:antimicrobial peptide system SdpA family protein
MEWGACDMRDDFSDERLGRIGIVCALGTALVIVIVLLSSISGGDAPVLSLPADIRNVVVDAAPQGWQFFTKDPQSANIVPFRDDGGHWVSAQLRGALHLGTLFGFDRVDREQGIEIGVLSTKIPADAWLPCKVAPAQCLAKIPVEVSLVDAMPHPSLCGDLGLANQAPLPWAWARLVPVPVMPSTIVRVMVSCK